MLGTKRSLLVYAVTIFMMAVNIQKADAQADANFEDLTESPYFIVRTETDQVVEMPLISTAADVSISGIIADVTVEQVYTNTGLVPIEAEYVFPGSTRSAVYGMKMTVGDREIVAKIKEKEEAKKEYEEAKEQGQHASLLQQHRPNVFQMNVANINPGDTVKVELSYTETVPSVENIYEFVFPTIVGPRYADSAGVVKDEWAVNPYVNEPENVSITKPGFDIDISLHAGMPIKQAICKSHEMDIVYQSPAEATLEMKNPDAPTDKDVIVQYKLADKNIEPGLLLYEGEEENFFLFMAHPPERVMPDQIPPREYIFVVDVSGSMNGFPLDISKKLMTNLLEGLAENDKFNVLLFASNNAKLFNSPQSATKQNIQEAMNLLNNQDGRGSTELLPALETALDMPSESEVSKSIVIVTDGFVTVEKEAFDLINKNLGQTNFFAFGIGSSVNRFLIEGMAHVGKTEPLIVTNQSEANAKAAKFKEYIASPVLTDIQLDVKGFDAYEYEKGVSDLFAEKAIYVFGKYKGKPKGKITLTGQSGKGKFKTSIAVKRESNTTSNEALKYLWAREKIKLLGDYNNLDRNEPLREEITRLGLKYNLLTDYTSFVAIDPIVTKNAQLEVNGNTGAVPEPHEWALIILVLSSLLYLIVKKSKFNAA